MKTPIKNRFALWLLAVVMFLASGESKANELVRYNTGDNTTPGSIIKHYINNMDVVCCQGSGCPYFMLYKESSSIPYALYLQNMDTIYDFEILNDTIYFCGTGYATIAGAAIIGYFDLATLYSLAPANVQYIPMPLMKKITMIETDYIAWRIHVVGIGESIQSEGMMVDLIKEPTYWNVNFSVVGGDTVILSDLEILSGYVVVTSKMPSIDPVYSAIDKGRLWYIKKPTTPGISLFPNNVDYKDLPSVYNVTGKYLIKKMMDGNMFVTAHQIGNHNTGVNPFVLSFYNGLTYNTSVELDDPQWIDVSMKDFSYGFDCHSIELLLYGYYDPYYGTAPRSMVYDIPEPPLPSTPVYAHSINGVCFESLDDAWVIFTNFVHFVAVGHKSSSVIPYYMKFKSGIFGSCLEKIRFTCNENIISHTVGRKNISSTQILQLPVEGISYKKELSLVNECSTTK